MNKQEIKKQVNNAVRIFKETLENTYLKPNFEKPLYGIGVHWYTSILSGKINKRRKSDGSLHISGDMPKDMFKDDIKGLPKKLDDYAIFPIVITLFNEDIADDTK